MSGEVHVMPNRSGGWDVIRPGRNAPEATHPRQSEAEAHAKALLRKDGGGEAIIHGQDGRIRQSDRVEGTAPVRRKGPAPKRLKVLH